MHTTSAEYGEEPGSSRAGKALLKNLKILLVFWQEHYLHKDKVSPRWKKDFKLFVPTYVISTNNRRRFTICNLCTFPSRERVSLKRHQHANLNSAFSLTNCFKSNCRFPWLILIFIANSWRYLATKKVRYLAKTTPNYKK